MRKYVDAQDVLTSTVISRSCFLNRPHEISKAATTFLSDFPGTVHYAVKCNPDPDILQMIWDSGIHAFEVASLEECRLIKELWPMAVVRFMHPVKFAGDIFEAYHRYGIRTFALDHADELQKILMATEYASDLTLVVRISPRSDSAVMPLSGKFGIDGPEAVQLLQACRAVAKKLGVTFHVGSQCLNPAAYANSIHHAAELCRGIQLDVLDVGGGFPVDYPTMRTRPLKQYFDEIRCAVLDTVGLRGCEIWCEPGRAMVAAGQSLLTPVLARRHQTLYIGEGTYGALFDAGFPRFPLPARLARPSSAPLQPFRFFGPTCDELDVMEGPFVLPDDIHEGDFIEVGQLGAYGMALRTNFNGFLLNPSVIVTDAPFTDFDRPPIGFATQPKFGEITS